MNFLDIPLSLSFSDLPDLETFTFRRYHEWSPLAEVILLDTLFHEQWLGGSLFGRWVALSKSRASSSHLDSECWTRENLGRRTDTPRIRKASVLTHANRSVCISSVPRIRAWKCTNEWMYWESSGIFERVNFELVAKFLREYLLPFEFIATFPLKLSRDEKLTDVQSLATRLKSRPSRLINY